MLTTTLTSNTDVLAPAAIGRFDVVVAGVPAASAIALGTSDEAVVVVGLRSKSPPLSRSRKTVQPTRPASGEAPKAPSPLISLKTNPVMFASRHRRSSDSVVTAAAATARWLAVILRVTPDR